jgi:hypothetical protein
LSSVHHFDPSVLDELSEKGLSERDFNSGLVGQILESGDGKRTQPVGNMCLLPYHLVTTTKKKKNAINR